MILDKELLTDYKRKLREKEIRAYLVYIFEIKKNIKKVLSQNSSLLFKFSNFFKCFLGKNKLKTKYVFHVYLILLILEKIKQLKKNK